MKNWYEFMSAKEIEEQIECFEYVRDENRHRVGLVVLSRDMHIGWSLYNEAKELEPAQLDKGFLIALNRASHEDDLYHELVEKAKNPAIRKYENPRLGLIAPIISKMKFRRRAITEKRKEIETL